MLETTRIQAHALLALGITRKRPSLASGALQPFLAELGEVRTGVFTKSNSFVHVDHHPVLFKDIKNQSDFVKEFMNI